MTLSPEIIEEERVPELSAPTLAARLTAEAPAALTTLALAGPNTANIVDALFVPATTGPLIRTDQPRYGRFGQGVTDDVIVRLVEIRHGLPWHVEIHAHGGPALGAALLGQLAAHGARVVDWRDFLPAVGRSRFEVELADALARAETARVARLLLSQRTSGLRELLDPARPASPEQLERALARWPFGRSLLEGTKVVLFGRPNVGKSSLLNAIAGYRRAVVSEVAGTTRDLLRVRTSIDGYPVELIDGAGLRDGSEALEAEGQRRVEAALAEARIRIQVFDRAEGWGPEDDRLRGRWTPAPSRNERMSPLVGDAVGVDPFPGPRRVSARTGEGIAELITALASRLEPDPDELNGPIPFAERHRRALERRLAAPESSADHAV
jgi:tRNA modification GTPase